MYRLTVMAERDLGQPLRIPGLLCSFRPSVAIRMESHASDAHRFAALLEFSRAIGCPNPAQIGKQRPVGWQAPKDLVHLLSEMDEGQFAGFFCGRN